MCERKITNDRTNATITTTLTDAEAAAKFAELFGNKQHWLWYHLHNAVQSTAQTAQTERALDFVGDSFTYAIGRGLKKPMIRVHYKNQRFKVYLSQKGTVCLKSGRLTAEGTEDPDGAEEYVGCWVRGVFLLASKDVENYPTGRFRSNAPQTSMVKRPLTATEQEFLEKLAADPIGFLAQCSKDMSRCCYCNLPLEDERSKAIGYGKVCAGRWGLPWGDQKHMEGAPTFAREYDGAARGLCANVRANPTDEFAWNLLNEWLQEHSLPPVKKPEKTVTLPREDTVSGTAKPAPKKEQPKPAAQPSVASPYLPPIPSDLFIWNAEARTLTTTRREIDGRWDCTYNTMTIRSARTGKEQTFNLVRTERNDHGTVAWHFAPREENGVATVIVRND